MHLLKTRQIRLGHRERISFALSPVHVGLGARVLRFILAREVHDEKQIGPHVVLVVDMDVETWEKIKSMTRRLVEKSTFIVTFAR
jgi:hypothetical protein